jgi:hypothetical protein
MDGIITPDLEFPILGDGAEAVDAQGMDYAGAVIPQVWCENIDCDPRLYFEPTTESNSPNVFKDVYRDTLMGNVGTPLVPIGGRIPQISGVSNKFLVKAMEDAGYVVGDEILVMVYNGTIDNPAPGFGNWENLQIIYYALAEITQFDANTLFVKFLEAPIESPLDVDGAVSRAVPWDWAE